MAEMTLEQVVGAVAKELKLEKLFDTPEGRAALSAEINKATQALEEKLTSEIAEERKLRTAAEEGVAELRARLARRESFDRDFGIHRNVITGGVSPNLSREAGDHLVGVIRESMGRGERALSAGTDSEGGYLVQPEYAAEIMRVVAATGLYPQLARSVPMGTDTKNFGTLVSGMTAYWPGENTAITPSYPGFGQLQLVAKILAAYTEGPENLFDDASPELGSFLGDLIIETLASELDRVGIYGDVTGASDPFNGLAFNGDSVDVPMATGLLAPSDVTLDHLLDMQTAVPDGAREGASYILSPTLFNFLRKKKDTTENYIVQPPTAGEPGTIWGKPYHLTEKMPAYSTDDSASTPLVLFGNWKKYAILGLRKELAVKGSDVSGDTFKKIQKAIRAHGRFAVQSFGPGFARLITPAS